MLRRKRKPTTITTKKQCTKKTKQQKKQKNKTKPKKNKHQNKTPVITLPRKVRAAKLRTRKKVIKDDPSNWEDLWGSSLSGLCSDQTEAV